MLKLLKKILTKRFFYYEMVRFIITDDKFDFKKQTPMLYMSKKEAKKIADLYYKDRYDIEIRPIKIYVK